MTLSDVRTLHAYNCWANRRILELTATLTDEQFTRDLRSSHGGIHGTLVHAFGAEQTWLNRWKGNSPVSFPSPSDIPTLEALRERWSAIEREQQSFIDSLKTDEDLSKNLTYKDLKGNSYTQPLFQTVQQVLNHATYHRGQVVTMFRQLGVKPVNTDIIAWYRQNNPAA